MRKLDLTNEYQAEGLTNLNEIMAHLKYRRTSLGLTQQELAELAGVSVSTVSKYERGLFPTRVVWLVAMSHCLGYKLETNFYSYRRTKRPTI